MMKNLFFSLIAGFLSTGVITVSAQHSQVSGTVRDSDDPVVVVGYGVQRKRDVTGSISSLRGDALTATPATNALQALQGRVAGLDMSVISGQLTAESGLRMNVRGSRSLSANNDPLIMVDGVAYGNVLGINPSDIESIEVLKDASSTAIFGGRGANGVILVTTKKGTEGKINVNFNAYGGINQSTGQMRVFSGEEYVEYKKEAFRAVGITEYEMIFASPLEREYIEKGYFTNWGDEVIRSGSTQNYELSVSRGSKTSSQYFSLGLNDTNGLFRNERQTRYNIRLGGEQQILPFLKMGISGQYTHQSNDQRRDPLEMAYKIVPISRPYDDEGNFIRYPAPGNTSQISPLADEQPGAYKDNVISQHLLASTFLDLSLIKNMLIFRSMYSINSQKFRQGTFYNEYSDQEENRQSNEPGYTWENTLNFIKLWRKHDLGVLIGSSVMNNRSETWWTQERNDQMTGYSKNFSKAKMVSRFGRLNYKFNKKYIFQASIRADGTSMFAEDNKWDYFPSASVGWRLNEESFMQGATDWLTDLKLRAGWGQSGNGTDGVSFDFGDLLNPDLKWETTTTLDFGIDFSLFQGRLSGSADYYSADSKALLKRYLFPISTDYSNQWDNIGKTNNQGIEVQLSSINTGPNAAFRWTTDLTFSNNREKIVELAGGVTVDEGNGWFVGSPIRVIYDYQKLGIWQLGEEAEAARNWQKPGEIRVETANADGVLTFDDRRILGQQDPKINLGIANTFSYKGFELSVFMYGKFGHMVNSEVIGGFESNVFANCIAVDYWTPENPTNAFPRPRYSNSLQYGSTLRYAKGDFWKIQNITLGYNFNKGVLDKLHLGRLRVYATATNFFTFCDPAFGKVDPERTIRGGGASFPMTRQLVFGINLGF
jgi:TonB-dependent SusC/RagA subfamily outer membrane receptor